MTLTRLAAPGVLQRGFCRYRLGQAPNPTGKGGEFQSCQSLWHKASFAAAQEIIKLSTESDDDRLRMTAAAWVYERAWGKPREYDPASEKPAGPEFDPELIRRKS